MFPVKENENLFVLPARIAVRSMMRAAKRKEMFEDEPAAFPPRHTAENTAVKIHRGGHIRRREGKINRARHGQNISEAQAQHAQRGDEKPDAPASAAQLTRARPMTD